MDRLQMKGLRRPSKCGKVPAQIQVRAAEGTSVASRSGSATGERDQTEISIFTIRNARQPVSASRPPHTSTLVELPTTRMNRPRVGSKIKSSLSVYLELMYSIGICPHAECERTPRWKRIHDGCYLTGVLLSFIYVIRNVKYEIMEFLIHKGHMDVLMSAVFTVILGISMLSLMYLLKFKWEGVRESVRILEVVETMHMGRTRKELKQENKSAARGLFAFTIVLVIIQLISRFHRWGEWSISDFVGFESFFTRATVSVWNSKAWRSGKERLWDEYNADTTPLSVVLSAIGAFAGWFGWIQEHMLLDIVLLLNMSMKQQMSKLIRIIQDKNSSSDKKWEEYEKLKNLSNKINDNFQYLLPLAHLNNLLLFSYFLLGAIKRNGYVISFLLGMKAVKILMTYYIACTSAHKNKIIRGWIQTVCRNVDHVIIKGERVQVPVLLDIARDDFIGLGRDDFFLDQKFLLMFLGTVGTVFMILAESENENKCVPCPATTCACPCPAGSTDSPG